MQSMSSQYKDRRYVIHPAKFSMWMFIVTIILFFGGLTSAYIVSKGIEIDKGKWLEFNLPSIFWYTSALIVASSVTMQWSVWVAKKGDIERAKIGLFLTLIMGVFFLVGQVVGWSHLKEAGVIWADSNAGSFLYILTGAHGLHIVAGLIFLAVVLGKAFFSKPNEEEGTLLYENAATFWHFLGILWVYLFIFLMINHS